MGAMTENAIVVIHSAEQLAESFPLAVKHLRPRWFRNRLILDDHSDNSLIR